MSLYAHARVPRILQTPAWLFVLSRPGRFPGNVSVLCRVSTPAQTVSASPPRQVASASSGLTSGVLCTPLLTPPLSLFFFPSLPRDHRWLFLENYSCPQVCTLAAPSPSLRKSPLVSQSREGSTPSVGLR
ncbi:unnamed protein product [Ectocarpus sp. 4 AP-2014]